MTGNEIAVIGMAGRFPGAVDVDRFWHNLRRGVESISTFSDEQLLASGVAPEALTDERLVRAGAVLEDAELFDAAFFGYSPLDAEVLDPQHRVVLECAWQAVEDAGYCAETYDGAIGVYAGASASTYLIHNLYPNRELIEKLGYFQVILGNDKDYVSTRISYKLNLRGPSINVQSACSTSLVAVHQACQALLSGECEMALAGGVSIAFPQHAGYFYEPQGILSPDGRCRAFDAAAAGTVGGNGVGMVLLKPLSEALEDGDFIHALIKGTAVNNDGSAKVGFTAPSIDGQAEVVAAALGVAEVEAETVRFIETHGTATRLGDPIEVRALQRAYTAVQRREWCALGSVKTNVGHLNSAAGVVGLIKAVLAVREGEIPASLGFEAPNPELALEDGPFYVNTDLRPWPEEASARRAAVSSFGLGGTNAHVVLEQAPPREVSGPAREWSLAVLSGRSPAALDQTAANLADHLDTHPEISLPDLAYTLQLGRAAMPQRRVVVARSSDQLAERLRGGDPSQVFSTRAGEGGLSVAFMFPGLGDHYVGMGKQLYDTEPGFRRHLDRCAELLGDELEMDLRETLFASSERVTAPDDGSGLDLRKMLRRDADSSVADGLSQTWLAHPALFAVEIALARLWMSWGLRPDALIGYSLGELAAAHLSGVLELGDALTLVARRARWIEQLPAGAMLAVSLGPEETRQALSGELELAAANGPELSVVSGPVAEVEQLATRLGEQEVVCRRLKTSHAFHSRQMQPVAERLADLVAGFRLQPPTIPMISCTTGGWLSAEAAVDPRYWVEHLCRPVRFAEGLAKLLAEEGRALLEIGPGQSLASLALQHPACGAAGTRLVVPSLANAFDATPDSVVAQRALGRLWAAGAEVDWRGFNGSGRRLRVRLPTYPFERGRYWVAPGEAARGASAIDPEERLPRRRWLSLPSWRRTMSVAEQSPAAGGTWLVLADAQGRAVELARRLGGEGAKLVVLDFEAADGLGVDLGDEGALEQALRQALAGDAPDHVLYAWCSGPERGFDDELERAFYLPLRLARGLGRHLDHPCRWVLLSEGVWEVESADRVVGARSALIAVQRVLPLEHAAWSCTLVDLDESVDTIDDETRSDRLAAELDGSAASLQLALRGRHSYQPAFEPVELPEAPPSPLRKGGAYLITGGLGGIGLGLAGHLWRRHGARLALVGRTAVPPPEEWESAAEVASEPLRSRLAQLAELRREGAELVVLAADVTDQAAVDAAVAAARQAFGDLNGVIHAAGVPGSGLMQVKERGQARAVLAPKIVGAMCLERAVRNARLDFFALFSSVVVHAGGIGQVDYCAANALLGGFARDCRRRGVPAVTIDWCSWQWDAWGEELLGFDPQVAEAFRASREKYGLSFEEGAWALEAAVGCGVAQVMVSSQEPQRVTEGEIDVAQALSALAGEKAQQHHERPALGTEYVAPRSAREQSLAELWQELLGIDAVGVHDDFFQLGGHSLLGVRLLSRIRDEIDLELPLSALFETPTIAALAERVEDQGTTGRTAAAAIERRQAAPPADVDQLSENEVDALLGELIGEREGIS